MAGACVGKRKHLAARQREKPWCDQVFIITTLLETNLLPHALPAMQCHPTRLCLLQVPAASSITTPRTKHELRGHRQAMPVIAQVSYSVPSSWHGRLLSIFGCSHVPRLRGPVGQPGSGQPGSGPLYLPWLPFSPVVGDVA